MHTHNHGKQEHWQILASKPPPLGRRSSKRKRSGVPKQAKPIRCDLRYAAFTRGATLDKLKELKTNEELTVHLQKKYKLTVQDIINERIPKCQNPFRHNDYKTALADNPDPKFLDGNYSVLDIQFDLSKKSTRKRKQPEQTKPRKSRRRRKSKIFTNDDAKH